MNSTGWQIGRDRMRVTFNKLPSGPGQNQTKPTQGLWLPPFPLPPLMGPGTCSQRYDRYTNLKVATQPNSSKQLIHLGQTNNEIKKKNCLLSPGWCGSVDWVPACEPKGYRFDSQSGHMPGLWARSPVGGAREATTHWCLSLSPSPSLPLSLKINKIFERNEKDWCILEGPLPSTISQICHFQDGIGSVRSWKVCFVLFLIPLKGI